MKKFTEEILNKLQQQQQEMNNQQQKNYQQQHQMILEQLNLMNKRLTSIEGEITLSNTNKYDLFILKS